MACARLRGLVQDIEEVLQDAPDEQASAVFSDEFDDAETKLRKLRDKLVRSKLRPLEDHNLDEAMLKEILASTAMLGQGEIDGVLAQLKEHGGVLKDDGAVDGECLVEWLVGDRPDPDASQNWDELSPAHGSSEDDLAFRALSVHYITTTFLEQAKEKGYTDLGETAVYNIEKDVIRGMSKHMRCPRDGRRGCAYVDTVHGEDNVGPATHMLSYTWAYSLKDIADSLSSWCEKQGLDPKRTYIWMCCVCVNQHRVKEKARSKEDVDFDEFKAVFGKRVCGIGKVVALMMPWDDPRYLKRSWCMYELFTAIANKEQVELTIIMPPGEVRRFVGYVLDSEGDMMRIWRTLTGVSITKAEASVKADQDNIYELVKKGDGGEAAFDKTVKTYIQGWFMEQSKIHIDRLPYKVLDACLKIGTMMNDLNNMDDADILFEFCWKATSVLSRPPFGTPGCEEPAVVSDFIARLFHQRGWLRHKKKELKDAITMYSRGIRIAEAEGSRGLGLSRLYHGRGRSLSGDEPDVEYRGASDEPPSREELEQAITDYQSCVEVLTSINELKTEDGAKLMSNQSIAYILAEEYDKAERALKQAEEVRKEQNSLKHPSNGRRLYNLGSLYVQRLRKGKADNPAEDWRRAKEALEESVHVANLSANAWKDVKCEKKIQWLKDHEGEFVQDQGGVMADDL